VEVNRAIDGANNIDPTNGISAATLVNAIASTNNRQMENFRASIIHLAQVVRS